MKHLRMILLAGVQPESTPASNLAQREYSLEMLVIKFCFRDCEKYKISSG